MTRENGVTVTNRDSRHTIIQALILFLNMSSLEYSAEPFYRDVVGDVFDSIVTTVNRPEIGKSKANNQHDRSNLLEDNYTILILQDSKNLVNDSSMSNAIQDASTTINGYDSTSFFSPSSHLMDSRDNSVETSSGEYDELNFDGDSVQSLERNSVSDCDELVTLQIAHAVKVYTTVALFIVAFICTLVIGVTSPQQEINRLSKELDTATYSLYHHVGILGNQHLQSIAGVSRAITSYCVQVLNIDDPTSSVCSNFPFVTDALYSISSYNAKSSSGISMSNIVYSPTVHNHHLVEWAEYSAIENIQRFGSESSATNFVHTIDLETYNKIPYHVYQNTTSVLSPIWQLPTYNAYTTSDINFNLRSMTTLGNAIDYATSNAVATFSLPLLLNGAEEWELAKQLNFMKYEMNHTHEDGPFSFLIFPVFDAVDILLSTSTTTPGSESNSTVNVVAGTITAPFQWKSYFQSIFSKRTNGVLVVMEFANTNNESYFYSYQIDGHVVTYLGEGDLHHHYFESDHRSKSFIQVLQEFSLTETNPSIGINFDTTPANDIMIHIYPTARFKKMLETSGPVAFTGTVMVIWMGIIVLFVLFGNYFVQALHTTVTNANSNRRLVNMLFPQEVQERMNRCHPDEINKNKQDSALHAIQNIIGDKSGVALQNTIHSNAIECSKVPIADFFPSATIFFADIAGFTGWSSSRNPVDVFTMLEALFKSIDCLAKRLGVFKVETIGDCYLCVSGLPSEREDHAEVMVVFACHVLRQVPKVMKELSMDLGDECLNLSLRVGIHSGSVTAGVLRGEKSRFQLFGDTVNTASRMESNGEKGMIQISNETAIELSKCGKEHWYIPREGGIEAKGKGRLQTHWIRSEKVFASCTTSIVSDDEFASE
jgi:class 3 adenylate cyclase